MGPCRVIDCAKEGVLPGGANAGTVAVNRGATDVLITRPGDDGLYPPAVEGRAVWIPRDALKITATGGDVPAFSQNVDAPVGLELTGPAPTAGKIAVARTRDLTLTWTAGAGRAILSLNQTPFTDARASLDVLCDFDATKGTGVVPAAALSALKPPGSGNPGLSMDFGGATAVDINPGGYAIRIFAINAEAHDAVVQ